MAKMTIAQLREREVERLARYKTSEPTEADIAEAKSIMNSFYRLCGLADRNLYLANEEWSCNLASTKESEDREYRWYKRLNEQFKANYGLELYYFSWLPSIIARDDEGRVTSEKIHRYFYD